MNRYSILLIRFILRWRPPLSMKAFNIDALDNNYALIRLYTSAEGVEENGVDIHNIEDGVIYGRTARGEDAHDIEVPVSSVSDAKYRVYLYKKGWALQYTSLSEATLDLFGGFHLRRLTQAIYNRRLAVYEDRIGILEAALALKKERIMADEASLSEILTGDNPLTIDSLLARVYGNKITNSPDYWSYRKLLEFGVESWIDTNELSREFRDRSSTGDSRFIVTRRALATLATHELDMQKHRDSTRVAKIAAGAAIAAIVVALGQLYFSITEEDDEEPATKTEVMRVGP